MVNQILDFKTRKLDFSEQAMHSPEFSKTEKQVREELPSHIIISPRAFHAGHKATVLANNLSVHGRVEVLSK